MTFETYRTEAFYDELFRSDGTPRSEFSSLVERINSLSAGGFERRQSAAERNLMRMGITFKVYGDAQGME